MTTFDLRAAAETDLDAITRLYAHYVLTHTSTFEIEPPDLAEMGLRMQKVREANLPWWVATSAGQLIGFCYVAPYRPRPAYRFTVENSVYVAPQHVGTGVGHALMQRITAICRGQGVREIVAIIGDSANVASIGLHRRLGFDHVGTLRNVGYKFNRWLDTVIMQGSVGA